MAKREMVCPFSDKACKNCSLYIGRHYLLCDKAAYRGHVKKEKKDSPKSPVGTIGKGDFSVPELEYIEKLDVLSKLDDI